MEWKCRSICKLPNEFCLIILLDFSLIRSPNECIKKLCISTHNTIFDKAGRSVNSLLSVPLLLFVLSSSPLLLSFLLSLYASHLPSLYLPFLPSHYSLLFPSVPSPGGIPYFSIWGACQYWGCGISQKYNIWDL